MATKRKLRKSSRKHRRTFRRKNRVKRNSKRSRRRVMRGGVLSWNCSTCTFDEIKKYPGIANVCLEKCSRDLLPDARNAATAVVDRTKAIEAESRKVVQERSVELPLGSERDYSSHILQPTTTTTTPPPPPPTRLPELPIPTSHQRLREKRKKQWSANLRDDI